MAVRDGTHRARHSHRARRVRPSAVVPSASNTGIPTVLTEEPVPDFLAHALTGAVPRGPVQVMASRAGHRVVEVPLDRDTDDIHELWERMRKLRPRTGFHPLLTPFAASDPLLEPLELPDGRPAAPLSEEEYGAIVRQFVTGARRFAERLYRPGWDGDSLEDYVADLDERRLAARLRPAEPLAAEGMPRRAQGRAGWLLLVEAPTPHEVWARFPGLAPCAVGRGVDDVDGIGGGEVRLTARDHQGFLSSWYERFGAEPYYVDCDSLELRVARPPLGAREAARVAIEQHAYCHDLLRDTVDAGNGQARSTHWNFWWD